MVIIIFLSFCLSVNAEEKIDEDIVIKVGFPIQSGLTSFDENGEPVGYTVEYLNEIKKYTGWSYEYVTVEGSLNEQLITLFDMLENGQIDMMGAVSYSESLATIYDYPSDSYGDTYKVLAVAKDDGRYLSNHPQGWNGIRIGITTSSEKRAQELKKIADVTGFSYELVYFDSYEEIFSAIDDGIIDATLQVDISLSENLRSIAKFSPSSYYFATTKGNQYIIRELNSALSNITLADPYFQERLQTKYFDLKDDFVISNENREYIHSLGVLKVLIMDGNIPLQYNDGIPKGYAVNYLENIKAATGLEYELIFVDNYQEYVEMIESGDIDLVLGIPANSNIIDDYHMILSLPILTSNMIYVSNKNVTDIDKTTDKLLFNTKDMLTKINQYEINGAYLDSYSVNYYFQKEELYPNVSMDINDSINVQYVIGSLDKENAALLNIINSYISTVDSEDIQRMIYQNSIGTPQISFSEWIRMYFWQFIVSILCLVVLFILLYLKHVKEKNSMQQEMILKNRRFQELTDLMEECLFEYDYRKDILKIQNNRIVFKNKKRIDHFKDYDDYVYIKDIIFKAEDDSIELMLEDQRWYQLTLKVIHDRYHNPIYAMGKIVDVHEKTMEKNRLMESSKCDPLTKLLNRSGVEEKISHFLKLHSNRGMMLELDIDNFKLVNDLLGHPEGDLLLTRLSKFIQKFFNEDCVKGRLGGDEFVIFIPHLQSYSEAEVLLGKFIDQANKEVFKDYASYSISISIGAVMVSNNLNTFETLYKESDHGLYISKKQGKNRFYIIQNISDSVII